MPEPSGLSGAEGPGECEPSGDDDSSSSASTFDECEDSIDKLKYDIRNVMSLIAVLKGNFI